MRFKSQLVVHQLQNDDCNCGVFVCHFFEILVTKQLLEFSKDIDISSYREKIKSKIVNASKIKVCCICHNGPPEKRLIIKILTPGLISFDCGHKFHKKCIPKKGNKCVICK